MADIPTGVCVPFAGIKVPAGYLPCDGRPIPRTHPLFAVIGTLWGGGDGVNTFNLPDMSRRTAIGSGGVQLAGPGTSVGSTGGDERLATHDHSMKHDHPPFNSDPDTHGHTLRGGTQSAPGPGFPQAGMCNGGFGGADTAPISQYTHAHSINIPEFNGNTGTTGAGKAENMPPSAVFMYIIKE